LSSSSAAPSCPTRSRLLPTKPLVPNAGPTSVPPGYPCMSPRCIRPNLLPHHGRWITFVNASLGRKIKLRSRPMPGSGPAMPYPLASPGHNRPFLKGPSNRREANNGVRSLHHDRRCCPVPCRRIGGPLGGSAQRAARPQLNQDYLFLLHRGVSAVTSAIGAGA
jgi:hypothetical protein